nr:MAG TPA: hypothetical protein [Caudoviricetes sp.]
MIFFSSKFLIFIFFILTPLYFQVIYDKMKM